MSEFKARYHSVKTSLNRLSFNDVALAVIRAVLSDDMACSLNSSKSFFHALGFVKLVLVSLPDNSQVRFHLWVSQNGVQTPHTHPWDFVSRVIRGKVEDIVYDESVSGSVYVKNVAISSFSKNGHRFEVVGDVNLSVSACNVYSGGEVYSHQADDIHFTHASLGAITLCVTSASYGVQSRVYSQGNSSVDDEGVSGLTVKEYREQLEFVAGVLSGLVCEKTAN